MATTAVPKTRISGGSFLLEAPGEVFTPEDFSEQQGLSGVEIPEAYGGLEMDKVTAAVIADHIAKYAGFATTWGAHSGIGLLPIVYFGTEEQKKKYLPRLATGELVGAYALSESTSGSDAMNCR